MLVTAVALNFTNLNIISVDSKKKREKIIVKKPKKILAGYLRKDNNWDTHLQDDSWLSEYINCGGDFGGGVNFFEKIFVEIFVFHI